MKTISQIIHASTIVLAVVVCLVVGSCTSTPVEYVAETYTVSALTSQPGYAWMNSEINSYNPQQTTVDSIKAMYTAKPFDVVIFVNPSCSCVGSKKKFPELIKTLRMAGVPESSIMIYSMRESSTKHPDMERFPVSTLPTFYITRATSTVGKIDGMGASDNVERRLLTLIQ